MRDRLRRRLSRAKYAAIGAALGGLVSRETAGTVAGIGTPAKPTLADQVLRRHERRE